MKLSHTKNWRVALTAGSLLAALGTGAQAEPLTFNHTPASNAIAQIQKHYGISISLKGGLNTARPVSFSVDGTGSRADRLQAISNLANALGGDFRKVYTVSPNSEGAATSKVKVDSSANVLFSASALSANEAIQAVAGADDAMAQVDSQITGNVRLSDTTLTVPEAAAEIARQTHTRWKVYYAIYPRSMASRFNGKVIGHTATGRAIIQSPLNTYQKPVVVAAQPNDNSDNANGDNSNAMANGNMNGNGYNYNPFGQNGYSAGFDQFGNYGFSGNGFGPSGIFTPNGVFATTNDPFATFRTGPFGGVSIGNGGGGVTVLPSFPYFGGLGGPIVIGGGYGGF